MRRTMARVVVIALAVWISGATVAAQAPAAAQPPPATPNIPAAIDKIFERWDRPGSAGCAVGVAHDGAVAYSRGYGMANLEYGVRIRPDTIFESGSVAKQFTAASIVLLALDGKLSLDDPVRKYVPELSDFGTPILIRHFLSHTSGLRSQWPMLTLEGRPPGRAVHTIDEILELVNGYKELNFEPGDEYLYNNTGFTLLSVIVQRVSGKPFDEFCQERLFKPLGMTRTHWRTDFTEIVEDRATAYRLLPNGQFRTNASFTNVVGNGGLLSTVDDFLIWNENLDNPRVGGRAMVEQLETRARLNDGFVIEYARGLNVTDYRGVREISHGGSTAGYQTFLAQRFTLTPAFPDGFLADDNTIRFTRDAKGRVEGLRIYAGRVRNLRFAKRL
jgi:CubicO group peptidase (beta-lactamase class C family)